MDLSVEPYAGSNEASAASPATEAAEGAVGRYRECLRNHAAAIGGQAYDGCGEFMPGGGEEGSVEALKCAACGCHRNFHRREEPASSVRPLVVYNPSAAAAAAAAAAWDRKNFPHPMPTPVSAFPAAFLPPPPLPYQAIQPTPVAAAAPIPAPSAYREFVDRSRVGSETPPRREDEGVRFSPGSASEAGARKRFRTKFTQEQKEKMQAFAEKLGWRIQKHDDAALEEFCLQIGVKRHVLKVWMHNNKNHHLSPAGGAASSPHVPSVSSAGDHANRDTAAAAAPISV